MTMQSQAKVSPMMQQWHACKKQAKDAILFFRMGDFYEAFYEDAEFLAKELELTLTKRQEIPMAGVPYHTCETYIDRLVSHGVRVAVAEQMENPKLAKGLVKREIVRFVTPGTVVNSSLLSDKTNNFFAAVTRVGATYGLAVIDLTTADLKAAEFESEQELLNEIFRLHPTECLSSPKFKQAHPKLFAEIDQAYECLHSLYEEWHFDHQVAHDFLVETMKVHSLDGFGLKGMVVAINAAGALLHYLQESLCLPIEHIHEIHPYTTSEAMTLDRITQRNLELTESLQDGSRKNTVLGIVDQTQTPMGARLMRQWVKRPLLSVAKISDRQAAVEAFVNHRQELQTLRSTLEHIRDLERLMMKVSAGYAVPRDLVTLRFSLQPIPHLKRILQGIQQLSPLLKKLDQKLDAMPQVTDLIGRALIDNPPARLSDGNYIRERYHEELDDLRTLSRDSKSWIARYQASLREKYNIKTLKVGYNRVFGYYIEISKGMAEKAPESFQRRQTLTNSERFITPELKEYESKVLTAEEQIAAIETELFHALRKEVTQYAPKVLSIAKALAEIDVLQSLAEVALTHDYTRPIVDESHTLQIIDGRHPVIEGSHIGEKFIPNDTLLDHDANRLLLITGPNMAGKSTYIRQVALITILAQIGSFVPAKSAQIGIVDKVFTRIGASDDLSRGQSTFMVEMTETANILHNTTDRSLVILDEIGRGTSTYDGISNAWSVAEYLLTTEGRRSKTLFATHYWELTKLEEKIPGAVNYNVAVHESDEEIIFLRKIVKGGTDKSYGIHVGRLAGLPKEVVSRAHEILEHLEENANRKSAFEPAKPRKRMKPKTAPPSNAIQLTFF